MRLICFSSVVFMLMASSLPGQSPSSPLTLGKMQVSWEYEGEDILFTITSPGKGWVTLGTNVKDDIVGATLYMGGAYQATGASYFSERRTVSMGNHHAKVDLGEPERAYGVEVRTSKNDTTLSFRIKAKPLEIAEHDLRAGRKIWLILAYSVSDDITHHSRFRRHVEVTL